MRYTPFVLGGALLLAMAGAGLPQDQSGGNPPGQNPTEQGSPAAQQGSPAMQPAGGQNQPGTMNGQGPATSSGMNQATRHTMHRLRHRRHHHLARPVRQPS